MVLLGDMNDEPEAATSQILTGPGGSEIGTPGALRPDRGDAFRLSNLAPLLPEGERQTRVYRGRGEIIDHILVSRALLERIEPGSVRAPVARTLPSISDDPGRRPADDASDHSPVLVTLAI
jgi:endonuclease/exonuclease/phosphatase family metal-dependent hydrolase